MMAGKRLTLHKKGDHYENDVWQLYHVAEDFSESNDLAAKYPEKVKELQKLWEKEARKYGCFSNDRYSWRRFFNHP